MTCAGALKMSDFEEFDEEYVDIISSWNLDQPKKESKRKVKKNTLEEDMPVYEKKPRTFEGEQESKALPIKLKNGAIQKVLRVPEEKPKVPSPVEHSPLRVEKSFPSPSPMPPRAGSNLKSRIAMLCTEITGNPQENMSKVKELVSFLKNKDLLIRKLSLVSLTALFKDIIPGYYIRQMRDEEMKQMLSKEVDELWKFEQSILRNYYAFLQEAYKIAEEKSDLSFVSIGCLCELLNLNHFNYHEDIIKFLVRFSNGKYSACILDAFTKEFKEDKSGKSSCLITLYISDFIKARDYKVMPALVKIFLHLRLRKEFSRERHQEIIERKERKHMSKRDRKKLKVEKEVERDMKEAEAEIDKEEKERKYSETLKHIFRIYFGVLKNTENSALLPSVLEGLSKFSHLISVEFFSDLLNTLRLIMANPMLDSTSALQCILTVFEIFSFQQDLYLDLKFFYSFFYKCISAIKSREQMKLASKCFEKLFNAREVISNDRVAAFIHRLMLSASNLDAFMANNCISIVKSLLDKFPKCRALLIDADSEGCGVYRPDLDDPDLVNPWANSLWLSHLMTRHYHPKVKKTMNQLISCYK